MQIETTMFPRIQLITIATLQGEKGKRGMRGRRGRPGSPGLLGPIGDLGLPGWLVSTIETQCSSSCTGILFGIKSKYHR